MRTHLPSSSVCMCFLNSLKLCSGNAWNASLWITRLCYWNDFLDTPVLLKRVSWHRFTKMTNNDLGRLWSRRKFHIAPAPELFFSSIRVGSIFASLGFHECSSGSDSEALIFHKMAQVPSPSSVCVYTLTHYRPLPHTQTIAILYMSQYRIKTKNRLNPLWFIRNKMFQKSNSDPVSVQSCVITLIVVSHSISSVAPVTQSFDVTLPQTFYYHSDCYLSVVQWKDNIVVYIGSSHVSRTKHNGKVKGYIQKQLKKLM